MARNGGIAYEVRGEGNWLLMINSIGCGTRNKVWSQATSHVSGYPQVLRRETVGASCGDAFLAALAVGVVSLGNIDTWNSVPSAIVLNAANRAIYAEQFAIFQDLCGKTSALMHRLQP